MSGELHGRRQCSRGKPRRGSAERFSLSLIQANLQSAKRPQLDMSVGHGVLGYKAADAAVCATALVPRP